MRHASLDTMTLPVPTEGAIRLSSPFLSRLFTTFVFTIDVIGLCCGFALSSLWRLGHFSGTDFLSIPYLILFLTLFITFHIFDLYSLESQISGLRAHGRVIAATLISGLCTVTLTYLLGGHKLASETGRIVLVGGLCLFTLWAMGWRLALAHWARDRVEKLHWLVLGEANTVQRLWSEFKKTNYQGKLHALLPQDSTSAASTFATSTASPSESPSFPVLGQWEDCHQWLSRRWSGVIIGENTVLADSTLKPLMQARLRGVKVFDLAEFYEKVWLKVPIFYLKDGWFTMVSGFELLHNPIGLRVKRILDIILSIFLLMTTAPLMLLTALLIYFTSRGPAIYSQRRVGEGGREFIIYKFRSMVINAEDSGSPWTHLNDERITNIGKFIRLTRIDELPQVINVLKGEMSFIGPRPESTKIVRKFKSEIPYYELRHLVKPGITGWAQVLYRYGSSTEDAREKLQYDLFYIKNYSLLLDLAIILKTIRIIAFAKGR